MLKKEKKIIRRSAIIRKLLAVLLTLVVLIGALPITVMAQLATPTAFGAPEHFGVGHYNYNSASVYFTFSAPEDMRAFIEKRAEENPQDWQTFSPHFQIDYKIDSGSWHYTADWDSPKTVPDNLDNRYFTLVNGKIYNNSNSWSMTEIFREEEDLKLFKETGWDFLKSHSITLRVRFAESFDYDKTYVLSPWSNEYTLSANIKADYNKLINHAPTLVSAEVKKSGGGEPYFQIKTGRLPGEIQDLHAMSGGTVRTEVWMRRVEDKDFKLIKYEWSNLESLEVDASDYFDNSKQNYTAESYEIKIRYALDLRNYPQSGYKGSSNTVDIYSPFSNVISHNMPAWSNASQWATEDLRKADEAGLIPDVLRGADLTKPITRKEFAAVSIKLYEKLSGKTVAPAAINPFKDTQDQEVLKAYNADITAGVSADKFAPEVLLNREQAATMLSRVFKKTFVQGWTLKDDGKFVFNNTVQPKFADDAKISDWAKPSVYFMAAHGIISGVGSNKFSPKATTSAEQAANYASATREQALAISVRMTEKLDAEDAREIVPAQEKPAEPVQPTQQGAGVYGVYMAMVSTWAVTGSFEPSPYWLVLFDDGTFYYDLPLEGLDSFDKTKSRAENNAYWGVYKINGSTGTWKRASYKEEKLEIDAKGNIKLMGDTYYKLNSVDGMKLNGAWTSYANPEDVWDHPGNDKPIIRFTTDGKFIDEGLFKDFNYDDDGYPVDEKVIAPGKGTYEIKNFTLILKYDDGRVGRACFNLFAGDKSEQSPSLIYMYRTDLIIMK